MKTKIILFFFLILGNLIFAQKTKNLKIKENKQSTKISEEYVKDPSVVVYKCFDDSIKKDVYVDFSDAGEIGFLVNDVYISYIIEAYKLTSSDSTWSDDSVTVYLTSRMPIDSIIMNTNESKIFIYTQENNIVKKNILSVLKPLAGLQETLYFRRKKHAPHFKYGATNTPLFIRIEKNK